MKQHRLLLYVGLAAALSACFSLALDWSVFLQFQSGDYLGIATFVLLAALSQSMAVESIVGASKPVKSSVAFVPLIALAVAFPPPAVVLAAGGMLLITELWAGRGALRIVFNTSQTILSYGIGSWIFHWTYSQTGATAPPGAEFITSFFPFYALAVCFFLLNLAFVSTFVAIRDQQPLFGVVAETAGRGGGNLFYDLLASPVALFAAYLHQNFEIAGLLAVVLPLLLIRYSYLWAIQLQKANRDLLRVLIKAIETRDPYTSGHSLRVSTLARMIAEDFGLRPSVINHVETAALLHDIGKIDAQYAGIISKEASLTDDELSVIKTHATRGADLLESLTSLEREVIVGVRHHHEQYDGSGYPAGLEGKSIPLAARIIMICDAVDAMLSDRPYRDALPVSVVRSELERCSGTQFDPDLVGVILQYNTLERAELLVDRSGARRKPRAVAI